MGLGRARKALSVLMFDVVAQVSAYGVTGIGSHVGVDGGEVYLDFVRMRTCGGSVGYG